MGARRALANPDFRRLWIAQGVSVFGDYLAMFAVQAAIVFRLHGSARDVSTVLFVSLLPAAVLGPAAGVLADRARRIWTPVHTMAASDIVRAALVVLLAISSRISHIGAVCFAIACVSAFFVPAQAVMIPRVVRREELLAASALMQQTVQVARIASPAVAGALVARFGEGACYAADAASFAFSAVMLAGMRGGNQAGEADSSASRLRLSSSGRIAGEFREGLRCVFTNATVRFATLSIAAGTFAAGCFSALAAIYVRDVLRAGMAMYGAIGTMVALGTLGGSALPQCEFLHGKSQGAQRTEILIASGMGAVGVGIIRWQRFPRCLRRRRHSSRY